MEANRWWWRGGGRDPQPSSYINTFMESGAARKNGVVGSRWRVGRIGSEGRGGRLDSPGLDESTTGSALSEVDSVDLSEPPSRKRRGSRNKNQT